MPLCKTDQLTLGTSRDSLVLFLIGIYGDYRWCVTPFSWFMGSGKPNSSHQAHVASAFSMEPSPQPVLNILI